MGFINNANYLASDAANVTNVRKLIYEKKLEIIKTPMVRDIFIATFKGGLPVQIFVNSDGVVTRPYDRQSNTYHPNGVKVYAPEVNFDYVFAAALLSLMMDLYPEVYEMNKVVSTVLAEQLELGTWQGCLTMKKEYMYKPIRPAFDIMNVANIPLESLPLTLEDNYTKKTKSMPIVSFVFGIVAAIFGILGGLNIIIASLFMAVGVVTGLYCLKTSGKKKPVLAILGILLSLVPIILPLISMIIGILKFFG